MAEEAMHRPLLREDDVRFNVTDPPVYNVVATEKSRENFLLNNITAKPEQHQMQHTPNAAMPQVIFPEGSGNTSYAPVQVPSINVVMHGPTILPVGPTAMKMKCHHCNAEIMSTTEKTNKASAHLACYLLCFSTCCCCWIPYCMDSFKKVDHKCPGCDRYLGSYNV